MLVKLIRI